MNHIKIDLERTLGDIDLNIFGGFAEHLRQCIYGGIYDPDSPLADEDGLRSDLREALQRLNMPNVRYPGGNFVSGYRWMDGVGPRQERTSQHDLAWNVVDSNQFGTNEFIQFCRKLNIEPYLCVNCGDGDMREAADWVEYCNGTGDTAWRGYAASMVLQNPTRSSIGALAMRLMASGRLAIKLLKNTLELPMSLARL